MLSTFRSLMEGPGKYILSLLIIAAFGVVGVPALSNFGKSNAIKVGSTGYSATQVEQEFTRRFQMAQFDSDTVMTREEAIAQGMLDRTLNYFTVRGLIQAEADRLGLTVTDDMIRDFIRNDDAFKNPDSGEFDASLVQRIVQANGLDMRSFRTRIENDMLRQQLDGAVAIAQPAPLTYATYMVLRQSEERDVELAVLDAGDVAEPTSEELQSYYAGHIDRYSHPEYRTFTFVPLTEDVIRERVSINDDEVRQLFDARLDSLSEPETRSFEQARFGDMEAATRALDAAREGTPFSEAVEAEGGTLLSFEDATKSEIADDRLADAVFDAEDTGLVGPVDGVFGTFAANLTGITPEVTPSFEDVRGELEAELFDEVFAAELDALYDDIQEAGDMGSSLAEAAQGAGVDPQRVGPVSAQGESPDGQPVELPAGALSTGFAQGANGFFEEVQLPDGDYGFIEVVEITPAAPIPFEEVTTRVEADYRAETMTDALETMAADIRLEVAEGKSFEEAVEARGGLVATRTVQASSIPSDLSPALVDDIFSRPVGNVLSALQPENGTVTVAKVDAIRFGPNAQADIMARRLRQQLGQEISSDLYTAYLAALESDIGVETNQTLISQRFGAQP